MSLQHISSSTTLIEYITSTQGSKTFHVGQDCHFKYLAILSADAQIDVDIHCDGTASEATINVLAIGQSGHHIDSKFVTALEADHAQANVTMLTILQDDSDVTIHGNVTLGKDVSKVSGHLLEENLILGQRIRVRTAPILDVHSSDVSASHGCRVERLDPKRLFYMNSRGLDKQQSQELILDGYLNTITQGFDLSDEQIHNIKSLIIA